MTISAVELPFRALLPAMLAGEWREFSALDTGAIDALTSLAADERVDLLLAERVRVDGRDWPATSRAALVARIRDAMALESAASAALRLLLGGLQAAGIDAIVIKGAALAHTHYPQPWLRARGDTDLFIRFVDLSRAEAVLSACGYQREPEPDVELASSQRHYASPNPGALPVDLHWRVAVPVVFADVLKFDDVWSRAVPVPGLAPAARALSPPDALLLACVHRVAHHQDAPGLRWLWDIHLIVGALRLDEEEQFLRLAEHARMTSVCRRGLTLAREYFATPVDSMLPRLSGAAADREPAAAFIGGGLSQLDILRADWRGLPDWRARVQLLREHLFPHRAYMHRLYPRWPRVLLPVAYAHRIAAGAAKWRRRPAPQRAPSAS